VTLTLVGKLLAVHAALDAAGVPHAFGGAIALAFYTEEPRGTRDVDVNIFVDQRRCAAALAALPPGVDVQPEAVERIAEDGQTRLWWGDMPLDVFFNTIPFHEQAAAHVRREVFAGQEIPILGPIELVVFKALVDRTKDWADIEAVVAAELVDLRAVQAALAEMLGADDLRLTRLEEAVRRGRAS
jgi:hypothetical protein